MCESIVECWEEEWSNLREVCRLQDHVLLFDVEEFFKPSWVVVSRLEHEVVGGALVVRVFSEIFTSAKKTIFIAEGDFETFHKFLDSFSIYRRV